MDMTEELAFKLVAHSQHGSHYDWLNIDCGRTRVGKARGLIDGRCLIIHSINIFPEFERRGYARETIEMFKASFDSIIADRVRPTAIGFWERVGFESDNNGNYLWKADSWCALNGLLANGPGESASGGLVRGDSNGLGDAP